MLFRSAQKQGKLKLVASKDGRDGSVTIHQDINLYASVLSSDDSHSKKLCQQIVFELPSDRFAWIQVASGIAILNGESLREGDGVQISGPERLELTTDTNAEILIFELK